ncbi:MAG TPA: alcohol dehydrogenase catalytic domain-containing protein [Myxococcota bacterium]|nr:alcohol dehydrogenase catalytic domain-containing protein [Myxococcota bacterium]
MKALVFANSLPRLAVTKILATLAPPLAGRILVGPTAPIRLCDVPEPELPAPDWLVLETRLCGLCGSDYKQVFLNGGTDNPMTSVISWPQILGHEVVGTVARVGPGVRERRPGDRVVLNPWLSCAPRGLPLCEWCARGDLAQCLNFTHGALAPGIHTGNSRDATGGFAPRLPAHESMCIPIPDGVSDEAAVLADPFSVSFHQLRQAPPPPGGTVLVYGCGTLGLLSIAALRALHPDVRVLAVARFDHQAQLARKLGADRVFAHRPTREIVEGVGRETEAERLRPWRGLPMLNGGVDVVYDTVGTAETLEVGVRVTRSRGAVSVTGVEAPRRFEWTPLYCKELRLVGSNAFGVEAWEGRRQHAMAWYLEFVASGRVDATPILTHRFALDDWRRAFRTCRDQGGSGAVKVLFDFAAEAVAPA